MKDRLKRAAQYGLPALQQRERDPTTFAPPPKAYQWWICPSCEHHHEHKTINLVLYTCHCGWYGNRIDLLLARPIPCKKTPAN